MMTANSTSLVEVETEKSPFRRLRRCSSHMQDCSDVPKALNNNRQDLGINQKTLSWMNLSPADLGGKHQSMPLSVLGWGLIAKMTITRMAGRSHGCSRRRTYSGPTSDTGKPKNLTMSSKYEVFEKLLDAGLRERPYITDSPMGKAPDCPEGEELSCLYLYQEFHILKLHFGNPRNGIFKKRQKESQRQTIQALEVRKRAKSKSQTKQEKYNLSAKTAKTSSFNAKEKDKG
ncbi:hypothetical protein Tco_0654372 [Tanacetum coccineum]|uniref:Uncharacterized protein n=1 Tax=Tanacetum coccineum TaxID=301880 RepID=A0ABQ4X3I8_9ASTR